MQDMAGARVLEIGSGRGGGSRYIARYHAPASVTGLDYSPETVRIARRLNAVCARPVPASLPKAGVLR